MCNFSAEISKKPFWPIFQKQWKSDPPPLLVKILGPPLHKIKYFWEQKHEFAFNVVLYCTTILFLPESLLKMKPFTAIIMLVVLLTSMGGEGFTMSPSCLHDLGSPYGEAHLETFCMCLQQKTLPKSQTVRVSAIWKKKNLIEKPKKKTGRNLTLSRFTELTN